MKPKKTIFCVTLITFALAFSACVTSLQPTVQFDVAPRSDATYAITSQEIIKELSAPEYRGRLTGSPGNEAAAEYLEALFAEMGMLPFLKDGYRWVYRQPVYDPEIADPSLIVHFNNGTERELVFGGEYTFNITQSDTYVRFPITLDYEDENIAERFYIQTDGVFRAEVPNIIRPDEALTIATSMPIGYDKLFFINVLSSVIEEFNFDDIESLSLP